MDEIHFEQAALFEQQMRDDAIARARDAATPARPEDFDGTCVHCHSEIYPERIKAGYYDCIDCAREAEFRAKLLGKES